MVSHLRVLFPQISRYSDMFQKKDSVLLNAKKEITPTYFQCGLIFHKRRGGDHGCSNVCTSRKISSAAPFPEDHHLPEPGKFRHSRAGAHQVLSRYLVLKCDILNVPPAQNSAFHGFTLIEKSSSTFRFPVNITAVSVFLTTPHRF